MGGHGGLNILPQKSWNVYNFDNREKVRKDEEEAARQEAIQQQQARQRDAEFRLEKLRSAAAQAKSSTSTGTTRVHTPRITQGEEEEGHRPKLGNGAVAASNEEKGSSIIIAPEQQRPQHFNFFSGVEEIVEGSGQEGGKPQDSGKERNQGEGRVRDSKGRDDFRDFRDKKAKKEEAKAPGADDEVYGFGYGLIGKNGKRPWYSTKTFMIDRTGDGGAATHVVRPRSTEEKKKKKKKQRKTAEELRAERLKREEQEQQKAQKLLVAQLRLGGHRGADRAGQPYYNQSYGNAR